MSAPDGRTRVLWVVKGLGPGGAERLLVEHARIGDHDRFEYEVAYLLDWKQHLVAELESLGVVTHCLGVRRELDPRWVPRLNMQLRRGRYDVVHAHSPVPASAARLLVRVMPERSRPAFVYTEHNRWQSHNAVTRAANRITFSLNDAAFAVSDDVRDSIASARPPVEVLVHGVDLDAARRHLEEREAVRAALGVREGEVLAVTVANLRATKNYPGLLTAARAVIDRGVPIRFAAAGQGQLEAEVRAEHDRLALGDRFELLGYRTDTTALIAAADIYVLASHHEGLPVTVMEALAVGVPVVAPAVGGLREAVDERSGVLTPAGDTAALADAIERVATDHELRARLARGAAEAGPRFSSRTAVARSERVYRELAAER